MILRRSLGFFFFLFFLGQYHNFAIPTGSSSYQGHMAAILSGGVHPGTEWLRKQGKKGWRKRGSSFHADAIAWRRTARRHLAAFWHNWLTIVSEPASVLLHRQQGENDVVPLHYVDRSGWGFHAVIGEVDGQLVAFNQFYTVCLMS